MSLASVNINRLVKSKSRRVFFSNSCVVKLNNVNTRKVVLWFLGVLGSKKYVLTNGINLLVSNGCLQLHCHNIFYYKYCVLYAILFKSTVKGLMSYFRNYLIVRGLGFKFLWSKDGKFVIFKIGFSHIVKYLVPELIKVKILTRKAKALILKSHDYPLLRETAYLLKSFKKPKVYKYQGLYFFREKYKLKDNKKKLK